MYGGGGSGGGGGVDCLVFALNTIIRSGHKFIQFELVYVRYVDIW